MNTEQVASHLQTQTSALTGLTCSLGRRGDAAFLRIGSVSAPERWAVVVSPGDRWFSVETPGGFSLDHFDQDLSDQEVRDVLDDFVTVAVSYARSGGVVSRVGRLGFPALTVKTPHGDRTLRRSLVADIRGLLGMGTKDVTPGPEA